MMKTHSDECGRQSQAIHVPFFSVVIPTFNRAEKLRWTIQTVLDQTFSDYEVLVMDDGSTDLTRAMLEGFADSRIRYDWAENSGGPATPRNRGIEIAQGDWVCFLDADDLWYSNKLAVVARTIAEHADTDVFCHNEMLSVLTTGQKSLLRYGPYTDDFYRAMLLEGNRISTSATTVHREFLNRHGLRFNQSPDYVIVEDYDLWLRIALHGGRFYFIAEPLGEYLLEDDNISSNTARIRSNQTVLLRDHVFGIQSFDPNKDKLWRQIEVRLAVQDVKEHVRQGRYGNAVNTLIHALANSPVGGVSYFTSWIRRQMRNVSAI